MSEPKLNPKFVNQRVEVLLHELSVFGAAQTDLLMQVVAALGQVPTIGGKEYPAVTVSDTKAYQAPVIEVSTSKFKGI